MMNSSRIRSCLLLASICGVAASRGEWLQDPAKQAPATTKRARAVIPGTPERHPYEGVYRLTGRVKGGIADLRKSKGYLVITRRHLCLQLAAPGPDEEHPLVNAGVREWRPTDRGVRMTTRLEFFSDTSGELHFAKDGAQEQRVVRAVRGGLRVMQGERSWLEFERIE